MNFNEEEVKELCDEALFVVRTVADMVLPIMKELTDRPELFRSIAHVNWSYFTALMDVGFGRDEALALTVANLNSFMSSVGKKK